MSVRKIKRLLDEKAEEDGNEGGRLPFYRFSEGEIAYFEILDIRRVETRFGERTFVDVKNLDSGGTFTLPPTRNLIRQLERQNAEVGDYVRVLYIGEETFENDEGEEITFNRYHVTVLKKEEVA